MKAVTILFLLTVMISFSFSCGLADEEKMRIIAEIRQELDSIQRHDEITDSLYSDFDTTQEQSLDAMIVRGSEYYDENCVEQ